MIKGYLIFVIIILSQALNAQDYQPMAVEGATWIYHRHYEYNHSFHAYHINGDTVVNNLTYKKLYTTTTENNFDGMLRFTKKELFALMRDDVPLQKVYVQFVPTNISLEETYIECHGYSEFDTEYLLYDFGLEVNDTITVCDGNAYIINTIEEKQKLGGLYKTHGYDRYQVLGNLHDLFYNIEIIMVEDSGIRLVKYCVDEDIENCTFSANEFYLSYFPMALEGATWLYKKSTALNETYYEGYHIAGDTIIDGINYKKLYNVIGEVGNNDSLLYSLINDYPIFFLRDDIENRKVWARRTIEFGEDNYTYECHTYQIEEEFILYDFNHFPQDLYPICDGIQLDYVSFYYKFMTNTNEYVFDDITNKKIYEQIGAEDGLFIGLDTHNNSTNLINYCITSDLGCPYKVESPNATEDSNIAIEIDVFPNPASTVLNIQTDLHELTSVGIYHIDGLKIMEYQIEAKKEVQLDISKILSRGLFLLKMRTKTGEIGYKKIVLE